MITNGGASFGIKVPALTVVSGGIILFLIYWSIRTREWRWWLIILGGGLNFMERITQGYVTDYWKIPVIPLYNNINDWLIIVGVILLIWKYYMKMK